MGRIAGVTAAEVRERLLRAAADVFAQRGYDGTRVADIARAAGVSNAALYAHFDSKAGLLVEAVRAHGPRLLADVLRTDPARPIGDVLLLVGRRLPRRRDAGGHLVVEALVAARRDPKLATLMHAHLGDRAQWIAELVRSAQLTGDLDPAVPADAVAHFCMLLAMGSTLIPHELHGVDPQRWDELLRRLIGALAPPDQTAPEPTRKGEP
jgi:AcrR family transcriptional regulator